MTGVNFIKETNAALSGTTVGAAGALVPMNPTSAQQLAAAGYATLLDKVVADLSAAGFAKNACALLTLTSTTAITLDLTALAAATGVVVAGDTSFATLNLLVLNNIGAVDLSVAVGASNPARLPLTGTTPAITVPAGSAVTIASLAGLAVDSTHKTITITPTAGGSIAVGVGGA